MNYDVILRSDVKKALVAATWISDATKAAVWSILDNVPIVDAETAFPQLGLVKEAFDMAKADLMPVVRCKDCKAWNTKTAMSFLRDGVHVRCCTCSACGRLMYDDDFCSYGERR